MARKNALYNGAYHMIPSVYAGRNKDDFEPQRTNNFEVQFTNLDGSETITLATADFGAPDISVSTLDVSYGNSKVHFAGTPSYSGGSFTCNDFIGLNVEKILNAWFKKVYNPETETIGKASEYKKTAYLSEFSPDYTLVRQWELIGCFPTQLNLGSYSQSNNSVRSVSLNISYDYAKPVDSGSAISLA